MSELLHYILTNLLAGARTYGRMCITVGYFPMETRLRDTGAHTEKSYKPHCSGDAQWGRLGPRKPSIEFEIGPTPAL